MKRGFYVFLLTLFVAGCETVEKEIPITGLTLEPSELSMKEGEVDSLKATITPEDATNRNLVWSCEPSGIVSVNANGEVTALQEGVAAVKCTTEDGDFSDECIVTVCNVPSFPGKTVKVTAGTFQMGSPEYEQGRMADETRHEVTLTKDFYMSAYEITNAQYCEFLNAVGVKDETGLGYGSGVVEYLDLLTGEYVSETQIFIYDCTSEFCGEDEWGVIFNETSSSWEPMPGYENYPVVFVTWFGAMAYADYVQGMLPTAAQWEYAARAGNSTAYFWGDDPALIDQYAWYEGNSENHTHPVGEKQPNAWGLYDMLGNVWEWCRDLYGPYPTGSVVDPVNNVPGEYGKEYELRGSSYYESAAISRCALRYGHQDWRFFCVAGFRVIFEIDE